MRETEQFDGVHAIKLLPISFCKLGYPRPHRAFSTLRLWVGLLADVAYLAVFTSLTELTIAPVLIIPVFDKASTFYLEVSRKSRNVSSGLRSQWQLLLMP